MDEQKIKWLGDEFVALPKFRRKNSFDANKASLRFIKSEVDRLRHMLSEKRSVDDRYELYKILNRSVRRAQDICKDIYSIHYIEKFEEAGIVFSGRNDSHGLVEIIELPNHPFFVACQFHPEFKSRPYSPHPLFKGFIESSSSQS